VSWNVDGVLFIAAIRIVHSVLLIATTRTVHSVLLIAPSPIVHSVLFLFIAASQIVQSVPIIDGEPDYS